MGHALLVAASVGIPVSLVALGFLALVHETGHWLWAGIPDALGFAGDSWWWVLLVPTVGGLLAGLAVRRLPGNGGHEPMHGFSPSPVQPSALPGVALAALATLPFGAVLGPEAPLVAIGSGLGLWLGHRFRLTGQLAPLAAAAGLFASISALFGNPLLAAFLLMEVLLLTGLSVPVLAVLLPGMLSAAVGYLVFVGVGSWSGLTTTTFQPVDLPAYDTVALPELVAAVVLAVLLALLVRAVRELAVRYHALIMARPALAAPAAGLLVGLAAVLFSAATGESPQLVLFSGETETDTVVEQAATWGALTVLLLVVFKALAYGVSLGSLFRGGPVFPALFLGVAVGAWAADVVPGVSATATVVAGMAAATSAMLRLPLSAVLLAVFLGGATAVEATSIALVASVVALLTTLALDRRRGTTTPAAAPP
jgi:H+/Cl- antiporter ClcA